MLPHVDSFTSKLLGSSSLRSTDSLKMTSLVQESEKTMESYHFDDQAWECYIATMTDVVGSTRVQKKDKVEDLQVVQEYLLSSSRMASVVSATSSNKTEVHAAMNRQADMFKQHYNFTALQCDFIMRALVYVGDSCAKRRLALPVAVAWEKLKETGMIPRENCFSTYMFILSTDEDGEVCNQALSEVATCHSILFEPNEKTTFLRMQGMVKRNDIEKAEEILNSLPDKGEGGEKIWKRLRTFQPLLEHYCARGDAPSILRLFRAMRTSPGVIFDAPAYALILGSLARLEHFATNSKPIDGATDAGFSVAHGAGLFNELAKEMSEDILELTEETALQLTADFMTGFDLPPVDPESNDIPILSGEKCETPVNVGEVEIDPSTGICRFSGAKLRLFALAEEQRQHVHDTLLEMARLSYQEFSQKSKRKITEDEDHGYTELLRFSEWLE